jgi:DNA-binding XRE family transcriptional regulator
VAVQEATAPNRIREFRTFLGITQQALARRAGVSVLTIKRLESGDEDNPHLTTARNVQRALGAGSLELVFPGEEE